MKLAISLLIIFLVDSICFSSSIKESCFSYEVTNAPAKNIIVDGVYFDNPFDEPSSGLLIKGDTMIPIAGKDLYVNAMMTYRFLKESCGDPAESDSAAKTDLYLQTKFIKSSSKIEICYEVVDLDSTYFGLRSTGNGHFIGYSKASDSFDVSTLVPYMRED